MENDTQTSGAPSIGKTVVGLIVLLLIVGGFVWYGSPTKSQESIKIGGAFGLTGICAEFGEGELKAATLAIEEANASGGVNGKRLELVSEDTQCENRTTVSAFQKLINVDKVSAVIGPTWGDTFQSGYPISRDADVLAIGASSALESLEFTGASNDLVFSTWFPQHREIDALEEYIAKQGLKSVSIVHDQDPFGAMMGKLFKDQAARHGLEVIEEEEVAVGVQDYRTFIIKVKAEKPDAIFISFVSSDHKAIFMKQAKELGIVTPIFASADTENPALLSSFASALEGVVYTFPKGAKGYDEFARKYRERFGEEPKASASHAYDAMHALAAALQKSGSQSGKELQNALLTLSIPGATYDMVEFTEKHQVSGGEFEIKTVKDGKFVNVK